MGQPGYGGALDTPRTNVGDATYLSRQPDFADISQEMSFQSPGKDGNMLQQMRNGRSNGINLRTPKRGGPLADRHNLPPSIGGAEFTPLLKSATRHSARKRGKENGFTAANLVGLDPIDEGDVTRLPQLDGSVYLGSRSQSYLENTLPQVDSSSVASTPLALQTRRGGDKGPLQDGNQLSLREQENVIDRIEKENFGLKLKIHFLEEALRKAGPGFSEAALKENTDLKVDKVTMQREIHRYKKQMVTTERDLEACRQQIQDLQSKSRRTSLDASQKQDLSDLRKTLADREAEIEELQQRIDQDQSGGDQLDKLRDNIEDLEADLREKDRLITEREDELEDVKEKLDASEDRARESERRANEVDAGDGEEAEELVTAKETIQDLEHNIRRLEEQVEDVKESADEANAQKHRAERDLEELQEELANKSVTTKGLSRQIEEKVTRLQEELDKSGKEYAALEKELATANQTNEDLQTELHQARTRQSNVEQGQQAESERVQELEAELLAVADERDVLQVRHDNLAEESQVLQQEVDRLEREVEELKDTVAEERDCVLEIEKDLRGQYEAENERLNDEMSNLQAEIREKDNLYDNDSEKWQNERQALVSERQRAEEKAAGLERAIRRIREAEGTMLDKESKLQSAIDGETERHRGEEAVLMRQVNDLQDALETRQTLLTSLRKDLSQVRDELRQMQIDYQTQLNKTATLEDEVASLRTRSADRSILPRDVQSPRKMRAFEDQIAKLKADLASAQSSLAEANAQREELKLQRRRQGQDGDTLKVDQDRLELRTAKMKLDSEVRRLRDENKALGERHAAADRTRQDEIEKAAVAEEKLRQEIVQLKSKQRASATFQSPSDTPGRQVSAARTIRELEQRIQSYEEQLAETRQSDNLDDVSDISVMRKELSSSRQKELEVLQRESAHKDLIKNLNKQIVDLEREVHESRINQLATSAAAATESKASGAATPSEKQLADAEKALANVVAQSNQAEQEAAEAIQELQEQLADLEDQKTVLEEVLDEARQQAEETTAHYEKAMSLMEHKLDKAERERNAVVEAQSGIKKQDKHLRKTQAEIENLEHDVRQQQELIEGLVASEAVLRRKLERARSERASYRSNAEKLQRDIQTLQRTVSTGHEPYALLAKKACAANSEAVETVVRAAEGAEERHSKEIRGMVLQMDWMHARWEREALLRSDAAFAKKFVQLQLDIANAWYVFIKLERLPLTPFQQQGAAPRTRTHPHQPAAQQEGSTCCRITACCI